MPYRSAFRPDLYAGRTVMVTGGGSGIGRCIAHELAALGACVVVLGRREDRLAAVVDEIAGDGGDARALPCDIRDEERVSACVAEVLGRHGRIDGLVNNAGGQYVSPLAEISRNGFEAVVRTNLIGGFVLAREVFGQWMRANGGAIVNITADNARGMPGMGHSGAARAGMENFTRTAAVEWAASGVRVNAVAPGWIASSGLDTYDPELLRQLLPRLRETVPLKRFGTEAEISAAVCFLLSDAAAYVSGATLRVDGAGSLGGLVWPLPPAHNAEPFQGFHRYTPPKALEDD